MAALMLVGSVVKPASDKHLQRVRDVGLVVGDSAAARRRWSWSGELKRRATPWACSSSFCAKKQSALPSPQTRGAIPGSAVR
jgi:hypothetical protein